MIVDINYPDLLPKGYREQIQIPEVEEVTYDEATCFLKIVIKGDVSHYKQTDNPIVEIFRAVEQSYSPENGIPVSVGCPHYDAATNLTQCNLLPNNVNSLRGKDFEKAVRITFEKVKQPLIDNLTAFFEKESGGFRDYQIYHVLLGTTNNTDIVDELVSQCNHELKKFIRDSGLKLPKKRPKQAPAQVFPTWEELLKAVANQ